MARGKKGVDGVDKVIALFPAGSQKMIERLLQRAADREARAAGRNVKSAVRAATAGSRAGNRVMARLASDLGKAMRQRGDVGGKASIRQKSPTSGGRPFHFAHSVVSKEDGAPPASGKAQKAGAGAGAKSARAGRAAAHMRYIEREIAVERTYGEGREVAARDPDGREVRPEGRERDDGSWDRELGGEAARDVHATSAGAGQGYIENPVKLANGERIVFSFGTIGERFEDRVRFWEALEEAEAHPSARVQHRLIVELPHEASPEARYEMVRTFAQRFERDGVPYWAALHAPGKGNDSRNYHAHIVYSERPAKRVVDPADGSTKWDFEILRTHRKRSWNLVTSRPYRQDKIRDYHARDFIPRVRCEFSEVANAVLVRDDVRDKSGAEVRYDHRSYKAMGVDAVPMRSINRIVADRVKDGKATILDGDYTRRIVAAELRDAASRRDKAVLELVDLENVLRATAESRMPQRMNERLPRELRVSPWSVLSRAAMRAASRKILEARHAALQVDVMERATAASLERVIAATAPKAVEASARNRDPVARADAPSSEGARLLREAALEELAETRAAAAKARRSASYRVGRAVNEWRDLVGAPPTEISGTVKAVIRQLDERDARRASPARSSPAERDGPRVAEAGAEARRDGNVGRGTRAGAEAARAGSPAPAAPRAARAVGPKETLAPPTPPSGRRPGRPLTPTTMEDALRVPMPPTNAALEAASRTVSSWLRTIAVSEPTVEGRIRRVDALLEGLGARIRMTDTPRQMRAKPEKTIPLEAPVMRDTRTAAVAPGEGVPGPASWFGGTEGAGRPAPAAPAAAPDGATQVDAGQVITAASDATPEENPDNARRRKRREEEMRRRKRKRQAVLARQNRSRER